MARLRLAGARSGTPALDETLEASDLGLLALDRPPERELAGRLLLAPGVTGAREEAAAASLDLENRRADGFEEPAIVCDERDRTGKGDQGLLEPLERLEVEMVGGLVEEQQVGAGRKGASERGPRQLPAGERPELAGEVALGEAEAREKAKPRSRAHASDSRRDARDRPAYGVALERAGIGRARGHRGLEVAQALLDLQLDRARGEQVRLECPASLARRALVVEDDAHALREAELTAVDPGFAGEHPQQRRLAGAVATGDRHSLAALELEGDAAEQRLSGDVLGEARGDTDGHGADGMRRPCAQIRCARCGGC